MGFGAELAALAAEEALDVLKVPVCRVTAPDVAGIPVSPPMEDFVLPNRDKIADALRQLVAKRTRHWASADIARTAAPEPSLDPWTRSALEIPQAASIVEVDLSQVMAYQEAHKDAFQARGVELNVTAFVLQATAEALVALPEVNSAFEGESIRRYGSVDILLEVANGNTLKCGIIVGAETRNLRGLAQAVNSILAGSATSKLPEGGTFALTDLGNEAALLAVPPVLPGHAAALRVGAVTERIMPRERSLVLVPHVYLTLSVDHRVLDGATAGRFLNHIKKFLEQYPTMDERI